VLLVLVVLVVANILVVCVLLMMTGKVITRKTRALIRVKTLNKEVSLTLKSASKLQMKPTTLVRRAAGAASFIKTNRINTANQCYRLKFWKYDIYYSARVY
jgi:hypothetical protein